MRREKTERGTGRRPGELQEVPYTPPEGGWIMADERVPDDDRPVTVTFVSTLSGDFVLGSARYLRNNRIGMSEPREWQGVPGVVVAWRERLRPWNNADGPAEEGVVPRFSDGDGPSTCPVCGRILITGDRFCPGCGAKLRW